MLPICGQQFCFGLMNPAGDKVLSDDFEHAGNLANIPDQIKQTRLICSKQSVTSG